MCFANLALAIERRRGAVHRIGFDQHLADIGYGLVRAVANLEQLLDFAKLGHEMRDVVDDLRVADPNLLGIVPADQFHKELLQRMRFRNHYFRAPELRLPSGVPICCVMFYRVFTPRTQVTFVSHSYLLFLWCAIAAKGFSANFWQPWRSTADRPP